MVKGYFMTKACITNIITKLYKIFHNRHDIFYDGMMLILFMNTIAKPHVKR